MTHDPQPIMNLAMGFWGAKTLLSAVELGVFGELARGPRSGDELARVLGLHARGARDFFDALVALDMLARNDGVYANTAMTAQFLDPALPTYLGGWLEMSNARLYPVWGKLTSSLRTGDPGNEARDEPDYYSNLCRDPDRLRTFLRGMTGLSSSAGDAIAATFPWGDVRTFVDVGGAHGVVARKLVEAHPHLEGGSFELPAIGPFFTEYVAASPQRDRLRFYAGDFFSDPLPTADVLLMGHVLHNWDLDRKRVLLAKAYAALPPGGRLIVHEALIDDDRRDHAFGLLMSLNMLLVTSGGSVPTGADVQRWMREAGFRETHVAHLDGPDWMVVATK